MAWLKKVESALIKAETVLLVAMLSVMVTLSFGQVVMRQFFGVGLLWGDTFLRHLVLWVGFLGAALATSDDKHFAWDTLHSLLKGRIQALLGALSQSAAAVLSVFLASASWEYHLAEKDAVLFHAGKLAVPASFFTIVLPLGFGLVALHALIKAVEHLSSAGRQ